MTIMHVLVKEFLCQDSRDWSPVLESFPIRSTWVSLVTSHRAKPKTAQLPKNPMVVVLAQH
jgi:hypothetical protein